MFLKEVRETITQRHPKRPPPNKNNWKMLHFITKVNQELLLYVTTGFEFNTQEHPPPAGP
jgi:hypothetical protein